MRNLCRNLFCFTLVVAMLCIHATATALPVWGSVQEQMAILYLPGVSLEDELTCQVGNIQAVVSNKLPITALDVPMETIVVLDNSFSIAIEERARIGELLEDLIANRLDGEAYTIATIGDQVTYLCQNVSDYTQLKTVIDGIQYYNQNTQLTDGLYQILEELHRADDGVFRRVVLIADGVDDKQIGYTKAELDSLIQTLKYPIYTIGCTNHSDTGNEQLQNLFSLSRITTGASYYFAEINHSMDIVSGIMDWNNAVRVEVNLPVELCDGSNKMIQITMDTGTIYTTELTMPFAVVSPEPTLAVPETPAVTPMLTESVPASTSYSLMLILVVCALAVVVILAIVFAVIFINRKKKAARNFEHLPMEDLVRNMQSQGTEILDDTEIEDGTDMVWDASPNLTLILHDVTTPARKQEVALQSVVAVGRDASICQVVLSYDSTVARHQCDIYANDGQVMVRNRSNSNITRVNDQKVVDECELVTGSLLKMGRVTMRVEIL